MQKAKQMDWQHEVKVRDAKFQVAASNGIQRQHVRGQAGGCQLAAPVCTGSDWRSALGSFQPAHPP
jgi:hypothetical protein